MADALPTAGWQASLADAVRDPAELCRLLDLPPEMAEEARTAADEFSLLVPRPYLARIRRGDPEDPLLRQVLPRAVELQDVPHFGPDPLGEAQAMIQQGTTPGMLQKYRGRTLILASATCGVHCRFCFRRHLTHGLRPLNMVGEGPGCRCAATGSGVEGLPAALGAQIEADPAIREVILSGGDPLTLTDTALEAILQRLAAIRHLRRLRIHTRLPIVLPERITDSFLGLLRQTRLATTVVVHANHPAEIDAAVAAALGRLVDAGVPVLSQTVLLQGVNDDADVLTELCERLLDLRVMPYYLHQLDRVAGAAHFEVPQSRGMEIVAELRQRLPGYGVPRYVRDLPGLGSKQVLA